MRRTAPKDAYRAEVSFPLGTERDEVGRVWCQLFPLGERHRPDFPGGKLNLTPDVMAAFVANWEKAGCPALPVDYEHDEEGPASGWIENLRVSPSGELEGAIRWTDDAAKDIKADRRRYLSPTWAMQHTDRRTGAKGGPWLYGAALTNTPFFHEMPRVAASHSETTHNPNGLRAMETAMDKKRICAALGLPEDTDDTAVMEAIEAKCATKASNPDADKLRAALTATTEEATKLAARVAALEAEKAKAEAAAFERDVDALLALPKAGLPAMAEVVRAHAKAVGLESAKKLVASLPDVPTAPVGTAGKEGTKGDAEAELEAFVSEKMKAGMSYVQAMRAAAFEKREAVTAAFESSLKHTTPPTTN